MLQTIQDLYVVRSGNGGCEKNLQGMVIAMSGMLRLGGNIFNIEKAFEGIGACPSFVMQRAKGQKLSHGNSCGAAILNEIRVFLDEVKDKEIADLKALPTIKEVFTEKPTEEDRCPECGEKLRFEGGCVQCTCGWSRCG